MNEVERQTTRRGLTRRGFLLLGAGTAAVAGLGGCGVAPVPAGSTTFAASTVLTGGYPRMLAFRQSQVQAGLLDYSDWEPIFAQFGGIIGKALQEEVSDTVGARTIDYFTRFKQRFPKKLVLLHLNGRARLPTFETQGWSAGWWLYRVGSVLTAAVNPEDTVLPVASTANFKLRADAYGGIGDDIVLAPMGAGGRPDFTAAEQVRLQGIDKTNNRLTVARGLYGTSARPFPNGAYLAPHEYAGPWSPVDDRVWFYNLSTMCPPDAAGRRVVDEIVEQVGLWFGPGGVLEAFDGLQLDVFQVRLETRAGVDADCDGVADLAMQGGVDTYLQGQIQLTAGMRAVLGSGRYVITDGGIGQQPDAASVNGVELEGFPSLDDYGMKRWSQALMTLQLWQLRGAPSRLSYPLYKFAAPNDYPVSFNRFRLTLAAALATGSPVSWFNDVGGSSGTPSDVVIWDELVAGTANVAGWLGSVRGEMVHIAERGVDLLGGAGVSWSDALLSSFVGPGVKFLVESPAAGKALVVSRRQPSTSLTFSIPGLGLDGPDVVLAFDLQAAKRSAYAATVGRQCTITVTGQGGQLAQTLTVPTTYFHAVIGCHGVGPGPIQVTFTIDGDPPLRLRGLKIFAAPDAIVRGFAKGAVFANPSGHEVTFDVAALFPKRRFARIRGSADQDPATNDGSNVGSTLVLGALDALVVRAV